MTHHSFCWIKSSILNQPPYHLPRLTERASFLVFAHGQGARENSCRRSFCSLMRTKPLRVRFLRLAPHFPLNGSFVGREHLLAPALDVEWIQHKAEECAKIRIQQLIWASANVHKAAGNDGASLKDIEKLLALPEEVTWADRAREEIRNARPPVNQAESGTPEEPRGSSYTVRWLCHCALAFPGLFLSDLYAAWALGISLSEFRAIADCRAETEWLSALSDTEYLGPLDEFLGRRWWRAGIDHLVYMLDSASTKQRPRREVFSAFVPGVTIKEIRPPSSHVVT
jgi:hypothetical protein